MKCCGISKALSCFSFLPLGLALEEKILSMLNCILDYTRSVDYVAGRDGRDPASEKKNVYGRSWKASELRLKSWDDLHKLWYVFLKEKNMLLSQKQMLLSQSLLMPNPERMSKVRKSMCRLKQVLTERALQVEDRQRRNVMKRMINSM